MNLNHMRHLIALVNAGSFRSAARDLNLSQSAITKSIKALEEEFGVPLIHRGSQGSGLTDLGRELVGHARLVCREVDIAAERMRDLSRQTASRITIGTIATASVKLLPEAVRHFQAKHKQIEFSVISGSNSSMIPRLIEGSLDVAIGPEVDTPIPSGLKYERLFQSTQGIFLRRGHRLARATSFEEFSGIEWVVPTEMANKGSHFCEMHRRLGMGEPNVLIRSDCPVFTSRTVSMSQAVGIMRHWMLDWMVDPIAKDLDLTSIQLPDLGVANQIGVYAKSQHPRLPLINELICDLKERALRLGPV